MSVVKPDYDQNDALAALTKAGVWDPSGDLQALVARHFGLSGKIDQNTQKAFQQDVGERCQRIPLGHILGYVDFAGIRFVVGSGVFIPRLQSMAMLQWVEQHLELNNQSSVYDLCAGVGAIGLSLWSKFRANVVCVEKDPLTQIYLERNIRRLGANGCGVELQAADITELSSFEASRGRADLVVCNPPYVPHGTELLPEWGIHHPSGAIFASAEGGALVEASARLANLLLKPGGGVLLEHSESQSEQVRAILCGAGFDSVCTKVSEDFSDATGPSVITVGVKL